MWTHNLDLSVSDELEKQGLKSGLLLGVEAGGHVLLEVPVRDALASAGVSCRLALPGTFELSEERWEYLACRERRLWSVLQDPDREPLGAIVTRFLHDHTRLRVPQVPIVFAVDRADVAHVRRYAVAGMGPMS